LPHDLAHTAARSPSIHAWWGDHEGERYWLEITNREDLGANLKAPQLNEQGGEYWSYALVLAPRPGDIVFHYQKQDSAIVACSQVVGAAWPDQIVWAARGSSARDAAILPHPRPGWCLGLESFARLPKPLTLDEIRESETDLERIFASLLQQHGAPLYYPFALSELRQVRPTQGYLTKLPAEVVELFEPLRIAAREIHDAGPAAFAKTAPTAGRADLLERLGSDYRPADEQSAVSTRDPFEVDPAIVERGIRGHAQTQNALACYLKSLGYEPRSPTAGEPGFDVAWTRDGATFVAEVKSVTMANEEKQLRLGLGQVLRYRNLLQERFKTVHGVLIVERAPSDPSWADLCSSHGVILAWPGKLNALEQ
jgi:hypothetical protein